MAFTEEQKNELLGHVRAGMRPGAAAELLGFTRPNLYELVDGDVDFHEQLELAEREATEHVEEALYQAAVSGNVTAAKLWLERRQMTTAVAVVDDGGPSGDPELDRLNAIAEGGS